MCAAVCVRTTENLSSSAFLSRDRADSSSTAFFQAESSPEQCGRPICAAAGLSNAFSRRGQAAVTVFWAADEDYVGQSVVLPTEMSRSICILRKQPAKNKTKQIKSFENS